MQVIDDAERAANAARRPPADALHGQGRGRSADEPASREVAGVAVCRVEQLYPLPVRDMLDAIERLSGARGSRVGAGRAGEHGRVGLRAAAARRAGRHAPARGARAAAQLEPGRRIGGASRAESGTAGLRSALRSRRFEARKSPSRSVAEPSKSGVDLTMPINIVVPEVGESIVDARVARWLKKEGDAVAAGEPLVELETDKVDVEVAAPKAGVLETIAHGDGADVKIGDVLGTIDEGRGDDGYDGSRQVTTGPSDGHAQADVRTRARQRRTVAASPATPSARKLAREQNVDAGDVKPSGPRVTKADVERVRRSRRHAGRGTGARSRRRHLDARRKPPAPSRPVAEPVVPAGARAEDARAHVEAPRDDRAAPRRSAADRGDAHDLQRSRHVGGDGAARAPEGGVQDEARRRPRHRVVLRQGRGRRAARSSRASTPRSRATRWCSSTTTTSASPSARPKGSSCRCCATPTGCRSPRSKRGIRDFAEARERRHAHARRSARRHVQHHQRRRLRLADEHADPQSAAGRHPRPARDQGAPGRRQRPGRAAADDVHRAHLRPPHRRRLRGGAFLVRVKELVEDPGVLLVTVVTMEIDVRHADHG